MENSQVKMIAITNALKRKAELKELGFEIFFPKIKRKSNRYSFLCGATGFIESKDEDYEDDLQLLIDKKFSILKTTTGKIITFNPKVIEEIKTMSLEAKDTEFQIGDEVKILEGLFKESIGTIIEKLEDNNLRLELKIKSSSFSVILNSKQLVKYIEYGNLKD